LVAARAEPSDAGAAHELAAVALLVAEGSGPAVFALIDGVGLGGLAGG
jgi:hypothetical protein